jgi:two-component system, NarL family, response regulator NreC
MPKIRIAIADDHDIVRSGLRGLLRTSADFAIVGEAADGEEAVRLADKTRPDVMIMDISMPNLDGIAATKLIKEKYPEVKVVILTVHEDEEYAYQILRAGASGYVLKNAGKKDIFRAIESAVSGERFFSPGISNIIVEGFINRAKEQPQKEQPVAPQSGDQPLTKREIEVLKYIALGYTNRQIADTLFLSFRTVNTHRANIMQKLDIHETAGLVRYAISIGLVNTQG